MQFNFDEIYSKYPRKEGKGRGMRRLKATIKTQAEYDAFVGALSTYLSMCLSENREQRFIKHWGTFCCNWSDYLTKDIAIKTVTKNTILRSQAERILKGEL